MQKILAFILFFTLSSEIFSQKIFTGKIVDADTKELISNIYIENASRDLITHSNQDGYFEIFSHIGDTLIFSSIGYYWQKYIVTENASNIFYMTRQIYEIEMVTKLFPYTYKDLTNKVLAMQPCEDTLNLHLPNETYQDINNHLPGQLSYAFTGVLTDIYNSTNRHAKNAIKAAELLSEKGNILLINKKFNHDMVVSVIPVPDEYFDKFIAFCDFSDEFLINTSEFQIIMNLYFKYERFQDLYPELKNTLYKE